MLTAEFKKEYARLNPEQKDAVDSIEGPVMVVAGPGTGKTQVLTLRIANILLKTDTAPENILALTFTDAAAANMRKRLFGIIGAPAYRVRIQTFHSFCNDILSAYPEFFPRIIGSSHITEVEAAGILEKIIDDLESLSILRPWGDKFLYVGDIIRKIDELKREGLGPEDFQKLAKNALAAFKQRGDTCHAKGAHKGKMKGAALKEERTILKNLELAQVYREYQQRLHKKRLYDWSDMIMEVAMALESAEPSGKKKIGASHAGALKLSLQEEHQYILVDEHQDTNNAQNKILEMLCDFHDNPNIFIVGDEKQAIFRFQGASVENFLYFKKLYPKAKLIELFRNYRSPQSILDCAHSLLPSRSALRSSGAGGGIKLARFRSCDLEHAWVSQKISEIIKERGEPNEIAVIYRNNRDAFPIAAALERKNIPYEIRSDEDLFGDKYVRKFIRMLDAIHNFGDDSRLVPLLHMEEFGIDPLLAYKLVSKSGKEKISLYEAASGSGLAKKMKDWARRSKEEEVTKFMEAVLRESGLFDSMLKSKDASAFLGIGKILEEAKRISFSRSGASLADFIEFLDVLRSHKIFVKRPKTHSRQSAISLMTAHRAKGLEFDHVFICGATENAFGPKSERDKLPLIPEVYKKSGMPPWKGGDEDERRLFYVCLTRAKKEIFVTCSDADENGREALPSPYIAEARKDRVEWIHVSEFENDIIGKPEQMYAERKSSRATELDREFVQELWQSGALSVTALNNYLECPWKYFYRNLLRIPSVPERYLLYGTAMHGAVDDFYKSLSERGGKESFLLDSYKRRLGYLGLSRKEESVYWEKGKKALSGWFRSARPERGRPALSEFSATVCLPDGDGREIALSGKLDKIEFINDTDVIVTDFKTGKPKSRNEIEGKTKNSDGNFKRQLIFYKLLLDLHDSKNWRMMRGAIEFLEPDDRGNYRREEFEISDNEVAELKQTIIKSAGEITGLSFWNKSCGDKNCEYCGYRELLRA